MKKYLIAFLFPLAVLGADLKVDVTDFKQSALTFTTVKVTPVGGAMSHNGKLVSNDPREVKTDTNGIAWFSNSVPRRYTIEVSGPITKTLATIQFTNTSGVVNASEHVTTSALPSQAYSTSAADGRFVQIANPKLLTESTPGYTWTATDTSGHGHWAQSAAAVGTNGLATIAYVDAATHPFTPPYTMVFEGDSLTANTDGYWKFITNKVGYVGLGTVANVATGGNSIQDVTNQFSSEVLPHAPATTGTNGIEFLWIGANGFYSTSDINFTFQRLSNHWLQIKSNGFALAVFTVTPRGDSYVTDWGLAESNRFLINKWIRESAIPDYIIDAAAMFPDCFDSTVYLDGVHISTNAHARLAEEVDFVLRQGRRRVVPDAPVGFQTGLSNQVVRSRSGEALMTLNDNGDVAIKSALSFTNGARIVVSENYLGIQFNSNVVWFPTDSSPNGVMRLGLQKDTIFGRQGPGAFLFAPAASGVPLYANFYGDRADGNDNILSLLSQSNGYPSLIYSRVVGTNILAPIAVRVGANTNTIFNTDGSTRFYGDVTGTRFVGDGSGLTNLPGGTGTVTGGTNLVENNGTGVQTFFYDLADGVLRFRALEVESGPFVLNDSGYTVGLNMPAATGTNDGYLTGADHAAFSAKASLADVAASLASGTNSLAVTNLTIEGINTNVLLFVGADSDVVAMPIGAGLTNDGGTLKATGTSVGSSAFNISNIVVSTTNNILLDLASFDMFKLYLLTNCNYTLSNASALDNRAQIYFQQDTNGNRTAGFAVAGGLLQTNANMQPTQTANALDLLEVMPGFFSTNLVAWWPKDFQPRVAFTNSLAGGGGGGGSPAFGVEAIRGYLAEGSTAYAFAYSGSVSAGADVIVVVNWMSEEAISSVSDTAGNTYNLVQNVSPATGYHFLYYRSTLANPVTGANSFTVTFGSADFRRVSVIGFTLTGIGATQPDAYASQDYYGATPVVDFTTVAANTVAFAVLNDVGNNRAYTPAAGWTQLGAQLDHNSSYLTFVYQVFSSAGAKTVGGTYTGAANGVEAAVVAFK
jgi:hypothetical protein